MKPFDLSKVMKNVTKKMPSVSLGKLEPKVWLSSGCYALNWLLTKDFKKAFPLEGFMNMLAGASGCLPADAKVKIRYEEKTE